MRINLRTPFADKDQVKALGARWDATRKVWYIVDVKDLTPFARWLPDTGEATQAPVQPRDVPSCGCNVLPWEHCIHTQKTS